MTVEYSVNIGDCGELSELMQRLGSEWDRIRENALHEALSTRPRNEIKDRTPESSMDNPSYWTAAKKRTGKSRTKQGGLRPSVQGKIGLGGLTKSFDLRAVSNQGDGVAMDIGFSIGYAGHVHEMRDPTSKGNPVSWSKPNSGNKFLEGPLSELSDWIPMQVVAGIDSQLRREGIE